MAKQKNIYKELAEAAEQAASFAAANGRVLVTARQQKRLIATPDEFQAVVKDMAVGGNLKERDHEILMVVLCAISGVVCVMFGPPSVGKSDLARKFGRRLGNLKFFSRLLNDTTVPKELFGIQDIAAMKDGKDRLISAGKLPDAQVAFLDEVFKSNSAILNLLLWYMEHESIVDTGDGPRVSPVLLRIAASNELPRDASLTPLFTRFGCRLLVQDIQEPANLAEAVFSLDGLDNIGVMLSAEHLDSARAQLSMIQVEPSLVEQDVRDAVVEVMFDLRAKNVRPSIREAQDWLRLARAYAWYLGETDIRLQHLVVGRTCFWKKFEHRQIVEETILKKVNPDLYNIMDTYRSGQERVEKLRGMPTTSAEEVKARLDAAMEAAADIQFNVNQYTSNKDLEVQVFVKKLEEMNDYCAGLLTARRK